jgi:non-specific serine/threonine protein kinase
LLEHEDVRLLTLTGPGGTGKTRLALALARARCAAQAAASDGECVFVDLATVDHASRVEARIAATLGVAETSTRPLDESIVVALGRVRVLVLDNFEHLLPAVPEVDRLLDAAPHVKVLVTSREPLHLSGEQEYRVAPLGVPDLSARLTLAELQAVPAVDLFVTRARAVDPTFALTEANAPSVVELVRRLDGLPLALELAAARIKLLTPEALLQRLQLRCDLLKAMTRDTPARHRTLAEAIRWSADLLNDDEARLFRALAVFSGGWDIAAVRSVCGKGDDDVLALLGSLLDKNLIYRDADADLPEPRYGMLQTLHAYAYEQLQQHDELAGYRQRHATHYLQLAEQISAPLLSSPNRPLAQMVARDEANFRAAMQWSIGGGDPAVGVRLGAALWPYWFGRCQLADGRHLMEDVLGASHDQTTPTSARARALGGLAALMLRQEDVAAGQACAARALHAAEAAQDLGATAFALFELGWIARVTGRPEDSRRYLERASAAAQAADDTFWSTASVEHLGILSLHEGDMHAARARLELGVSLHRAAKHTWALAGGLLALAYADTALGAHSAARSALAESIDIYQGFGDQLGLANCLDALAQVCLSQKCATQAVRLFGSAETLRESVGVDARWSIEPTRAAALETLRVELGQRGFCEGWTAGRELAMDDVVSEALQEPEPSSQPITRPGLTARELEVAALIPLGMSNREIAERLIIGERTVESHVSHVLAKLQLSSRSRLASWAVEAGVAAKSNETVGGWRRVA